MSVEREMVKYINREHQSVKLPRNLSKAIAEGQALTACFHLYVGIQFLAERVESLEKELEGKRRK